MEANPRAAAIAELVLWIGHLQWHIRTKGGLPSEPILKAFKNIVVKDAVLAAEKTLAPLWRIVRDTTRTRVSTRSPFRLRTISRSAAFASLAQTWTLTASEFSAKHYRLTLTGLYNVLERLREGIGPEALNANEKRVFDDGLVLILKELHDRLDAAVADAYGWPVDLSDEDILARLVALNNERAKDEARGLVAWLRPEYQIPRSGTAKEKAELDLIGGGESREAPIVAGPRPAFPSDDFAQTAAVMSALAAASAPLDAAAIAAGFKQSRKIAPKVSAVLAALARTGFVTTDGARFSMRRAA